MVIHAKAFCAQGRRYDHRVIELRDGRIESINEGTRGDITVEYATAGLLDMHIHGGHGFDIMHFSPDELSAWLEGLFACGVTAVLPSVYTGPVDVMRASIRKVRDAMLYQADGARASARVLGVHLEGPFISDQRPGAMDERYILPPQIARYRQIVDGMEDAVKLVTLAPEVPGCDELIRHLRAHNIAIQAGHTDAAYEQARRAFASGVGGVCHFYNGMRGFTHRDPGILAAAMLDDSVFCELIADMVHVHPAAARLLIKSIGYDRTILVSDAVKTTGLPDGTYVDNGLRITVRDGESRVEGGSLNGGGCYLPGSVKRLVEIGVPVEKAFHMASDTARGFLGLKPASLCPGDAAELACFDQNFTAVLTVAGTAVWKGGGGHGGAWD